MTPPAIVLDSVCKRFGRQHALRHVSFTVPAGHVVGFVGPNGSGKTTTLRIISGFLDPDSGRVEVAGHEVASQRYAARAHIGYMPETVPVYRDMRVQEYLAFRGRLKGLGKVRAAERVDEVCETCGLARERGRIIGGLSKGYRQRVGLADVLMAEPSILLLDEPTSGLDPLQVREFRALMKELARERTVLLSSHVLPDVQTVADRVLVMGGGRLLGDGSLDELRAQCGLDDQASLEDVFLALARDSAELSGPFVAAPEDA